MINKDEVLELLEEADRPPARGAAGGPLAAQGARGVPGQGAGARATTSSTQARARAERMVQRTEVVKAAEQRARQIVEAAEAEARRLRHEAEDFCDQKLASFEIVLERTTKTVQAGREKLQGRAARRPATPRTSRPTRPEATPSGFFDQDQQ